MKKTKKLRLERIVNARAKLLQEEQRLNEFDWGALGTGVLDMAKNLSIPGQLYNTANDLYTGGKNIAAGQSWKDAGGDFLNKKLDQVQQMGDVAGMIPAVGAVPDLLNVGISGARGAAADYMGDKQGAKDHYTNAAYSSAAAIPGAGLAAGGAKIGKNLMKVGKATKYGGKTTKQVAKTQKGKPNYGSTPGLATDVSNWWNKG